MMEWILAPENLAEAWKRVKANKGAPGIDGMTVEAFPAFCREHWPRIRQAIENGTYNPAPVRRVFIPKSTSASPDAAVVLDPLDKKLEARGHKFARYADDFIVMVKSARAAERVIASLIRFAEDKLKLVVNRAKSRAAPLKACSFLGFQVGTRGKVTWTTKVLTRFKERVREITSRNRGTKVADVIDELRLYATGWLNYFAISHTYKVVVDLADWVRRRVRLYYWKQWKQPRTRRRSLLKLGADPSEVKLASRSRKGYWRMSSNRIVQQAMTNLWLEEQGVPNVRTLWIKLHYGPKARV